MRIARRRHVPSESRARVGVDDATCSATTARSAALDAIANGRAITERIGRQRLSVGAAPPPAEPSERHHPARRAAGRAPGSTPRLASLLLDNCAADGRQVAVDAPPAGAVAMKSWPADEIDRARGAVIEARVTPRQTLAQSADAPKSDLAGVVRDASVAEAASCPRLCDQLGFSSRLRATSSPCDPSGLETDASAERLAYEAESAAPSVRLDAGVANLGALDADAATATVDGSTRARCALVVGSAPRADRARPSGRNAFDGGMP